MRLIIYIALIMVVACKKSGSGDNTKPSITLTSPTANQQFGGFVTVSLAGTVVDDDKLHEVHVYVINKGTNAEVVHIRELPNSAVYTINSSFVTQPNTTYRIQVVADDAVGNASMAEIEVKAN